MIRQICTKFFYWWYNQPGTNTEQGFNEWLKTNEGKLIIESFKKHIVKVFKQNYCLIHDIDSIPDFSITEDKYDKIINEILNLE